MNSDQDARLREIDRNVKRLISVVDGDEERDIKGLRPRTTTLEEKMEKLMEDRRTAVTWIKAFLAGLGLNIAATLILLLTIARRLMDAGG